MAKAPKIEEVINALRKGKANMERVATFKNEVWLIEEGTKVTDFLTYDEKLHIVDVSESSLSRIVRLGDVSVLSEDLVSQILIDRSKDAPGDADWLASVRKSREWRAYKEQVARIVGKFQEILTPMRKVFAIIDSDTGKGKKEPAPAPRPPAVKAKKPKAACKYVDDECDEVEDLDDDDEETANELARELAGESSQTAPPEKKKKKKRVRADDEAKAKVKTEPGTESKPKKPRVQATLQLKPVASTAPETVAAPPPFVAAPPPFVAAPPPVAVPDTLEEDAQEGE